MIRVCSQRTQAGAKQFVADAGMHQRELKARPRTVYTRPAPPAFVMVIGARSPRTPLHHIIDLVARMHGCTFDAVMSRSRRRYHVVARHAAICAARQSRPGLSLPSLGKLFGGRDHTTILHAMRKRGFR